MNCQDKSLSQLHCREVSVLLQPLRSAAIRVSFELSGSVIVRRCLQCGHKGDKMHPAEYEKKKEKTVLWSSPRIHKITDLTAKTWARQNTAVSPRAHTSFNLAEYNADGSDCPWLFVRTSIFLYFPFFFFFDVTCMICWCGDSESFICRSSRPHLPETAVIRLMTGKPGAQMESYLSQAGAPQVSQAEKAKRQNQEDQGQNQCHPLVGTDLGPLLFPHLNLQTAEVQYYTFNHVYDPHNHMRASKQPNYCNKETYS